MRSVVPILGLSLLSVSIVALQASCTRDNAATPARDTIAPSSAPAASPVINPGSGFAPDTAPSIPEGFYVVSEVEDSIVRQKMPKAFGWVVQVIVEAGPEFIVRADSSDAAPMVAYVDYWPQHDGGWAAVRAANERFLQGDLVRVSDDEYGLVTVAVTGHWAHVVYGSTSVGEPRLGWIRLIPGRHRFTRTLQQLD